MIETTSKVIAAGDVYGRYTVLGVFKEEGAYPKFGRVQCSCGSPPRYVGITALRSKQAQSCGCLHKERVTKHGEWKNPLFKVWKAMISRCSNTNDKRYPRYGGRGVVVCERWMDVHQFIADVERGYEPGLQLDRKNNDSGYEPSNCQWATAKQQTRNYSRNVVLEHDGKRLCVVDWAAEVGIPAPVLYDRIDRGWTAARTLTTSVMSTRESSHIARQVRWGVDSK
ncbi:MAG: hypothetical protein WCP82_08480 [Alphaproteobacteria bacterium]